jgi:hypothetical protein
MRVIFRILCIVFGLLAIVISLGYFFQLTFATALWPWPDGKLSYVFVASIMAAIAVPLLWIGTTGQFGAVVGGAINLAVTFGGAAIFFFQLTTNEPRLMLWAITCAIFALLNVGMMLWGMRQPTQDNRPMPQLAKYSFVIFAGVLSLAALALLLRVPTIFPWPLDPRSSVLFGWILMGSMTYFVYALIRPNWHNAKGQLLGFLAYDLVLLIPFIQHFSAVKPEHLLSLIIYMIVIGYSAALAMYLLLVARSTHD